jgi:hypothetical protein
VIGADDFLMFSPFLLANSHCMVDRAACNLDSDSQQLEVVSLGVPVLKVT